MLIGRRKKIAYASYQPFYIADVIHPRDMSDMSFWSQEAYEKRLAGADGTIGIGTGSHGNVMVILEICDAVSVLLSRLAPTGFAVAVPT